MTEFNFEIFQDQLRQKIKVDNFVFVLPSI